MNEPIRLGNFTVNASGGGFSGEDLQQLLTFDQPETIPVAVLVFGMGPPDAEGLHSFGSRIGFPQEMPIDSKLQLLELIQEEVQALSDRLRLEEPEANA